MDSEAGMKHGMRGGGMGGMRSDHDDMPDDHRKKARERAAAKAYDRAKASSAPGEGSRFQAMEGMMEAKGAKSPGGLAAFIGRKKYGKARFQKMAAAGHKE